jgi:glucuronosyltransferase
MNIATVEKTGRGLMLDVDTMDEEKITKALKEILGDPKYKQNAEIIAKRFHDRPMTPSQTVVYWTEYVARHNGAKFLRSVGSDYNMIEFFSVDVYVVLFALLFVVIYVKYAVLKFILRKIFCTSSKKQKVN